MAAPYHDRPGSEDRHVMGDGRNRVAVVTWSIATAVGIVFWIVCGPRLWALVASVLAP